jgi:hypothetical protein
MTIHEVVACSMRKTWFSTLFILILFSNAIANPEKVVEAEGWASLGDDTTPAVAKATALNNARRSALEKAVGVAIRGSSVVYNSELISDLVHTATKGLIVKEDILESNCNIKDNQILCMARIKAYVKPLSLERRGTFRILRAHLRRPGSTITTSNPVFQFNDEIQVRVKVNEDSYIQIFSIDQYGNVSKLYPNRYSPQDLVPGKEEFVFPNDAQRTMGLKLRVTTPKNLKSAVESVLVIASTKKIDILTAGMISNPTITDLMRELSVNDPSIWVEKTLGYEVRK